MNRDLFIFFILQNELKTKVLSLSQFYVYLSVCLSVVGVYVSKRYMLKYL